ncbi:hypothetical protein CI109_106910 [Kwoniella shandongensis]|uniref:NAD(P)-binding domain-containing protein n=1 Tax=Kwoniella shandongensis TaxID=1734106 RepID=A0A5M6CB47_9TREE|nr:uncharacterized protein CI109_000835 [Kwoniella shandongensis]KAA5530655.1 hypothetical protein CI109_000835 [Kwoniella shandongensis]
MSGKSVFFTGATGYIGGTVLQSLINSSTPPSRITALIRDPKKSDLLTSIPSAKSKGIAITPLVGSLSDLDKVRDAAADADVVVSTADADDLEAVKAILEGLKLRKEKTGHRGVLIHTSGTGVLIDDAKGEYPNDKIYTDLNPTPATRTSPALLSLADLPPSAPHREVDLAIIAADKAGDVKSYIILPSTIWGPGEGEVYESGLSNSFSDQIPTLIKAALDRQRAGVVGKGKNIWPHVRITDLGKLYALVYEKSTLAKATIGHGPSGYYLGIAGEYTLFGAASRIGQALLSAKLVPQGTETTPTTFTKEELDRYYGGSDYMGTNSRGVADRSKSIGWKPKYTEDEDMFKYIDTESVRIEKTFGKEWSTKNKVKAY